MEQLQLGPRQCWYGYLEKGCLIRAGQGVCRLRNLSAETDGMAYFACIRPDQPHLVFRSGWMMLEPDGEQRCQLTMRYPCAFWLRWSPLVWLRARLQQCRLRWRLKQHRT